MKTLAKDLDAQGWGVIAVAIIGLAVSIIPVSILTIGVFIKPLGQDLGWGRGQVSLAITLLSLTMACSLPIAGKVIDRVGVRVPLTISLILYSLSIALIPIAVDAGGAFGFYAVFLWLGIVGAPSSSVAFVKILSGRFDESRGLALGFAMSGIAIGGAVLPVLVASVIEGEGWRAGFYVLAVLPVSFGLPAGIYLTRPDAARLEDAGKNSEPLPGVSVSQAMRSPVLATLFFLFLIDAAAIHGLQIHLAPLLSDRGLDPSQAALGVAWMFGVSVLVRFLAGFLFDRVFAPWIGAGAFLLATVGAALLIPHEVGAAGIIAVALLGVGAGSESDLLAFLVSRYFGLRNFAAIFGIVFGAFMIGSAIGPLLIGLSFDASGSYLPSLIICTSVLALVTILMMTLPRFPSWVPVQETPDVSRDNK